jgi:hypothetical protein
MADTLKINGVDLMIQLALIGGIGYFAITFGPQILSSVANSIQSSLNMNAVPVSGQSSTTTTSPCTTGNPQMDQMLQSLGMSPCANTQGSGGNGVLNPGVPNALGSALLNSGGYPNPYGAGLFPGTTPTGSPNYPYYTGAPQFAATPAGMPNMICQGGQCRSYFAGKFTGAY